MVATLWPVADRHATALAKTGYDSITGPGRTADCAAALRSTTSALRTRHPARPHIWAPFIHLGSSAGELATKPVR
ncbi:CHAT domain-containing protein [Actinophytocola gossypii]|uniref:CHAT domain-containing protein n=1 Tax=Actinophytocola gossypii TaxID=2812003 RepID=A0ABT2JD45_9PSEU|nr:CHAT domain-containing protein [Actinophytocola gossypii]